MTAPSHHAAALVALGRALVAERDPREALHLAAAQLDMLATLAAPRGGELPEEIARVRRAAVAGLAAIRGELDSVIVRPAMGLTP
jgi:hypothetical protein